MIICKENNIDILAKLSADQTWFNSKLENRIHRAKCSNASFFTQLDAGAYQLDLLIELELLDCRIVNSQSKGY